MNQNTLFNQGIVKFAVIQRCLSSDACICFLTNKTNKNKKLTRVNLLEIKKTKTKMGSREQAQIKSQIPLKNTHMNRHLYTCILTWRLLTPNKSYFNNITRTFISTLLALLSAYLLTLTTTQNKRLNEQARPLFLFFYNSSFIYIS